MLDRSAHNLKDYLDASVSCSCVHQLLRIVTFGLRLLKRKLCRVFRCRAPCEEEAKILLPTNPLVGIIQ